MNMPNIPYATEHPIEIERLAKSGQVILLDVREQEEWDDGHLQHARLLPLSKIQEMTSASETGLSTELPVYSHCKAGIRSVYAAAFLQRLGIRCQPMREGFEDLVAAGLETTPR